MATVERCLRQAGLTPGRPSRGLRRWSAAAACLAV